MTRKPKLSPLIELVNTPPSVDPAAAQGLCRLVFNIRLITPIVGGEFAKRTTTISPGAAQPPFHLDHVVSDQLRKWWRTMQSAEEFANTGELNKAEARIFGGRANSGAIKLSCSIEEFKTLVMYDDQVNRTNGKYFRFVCNLDSHGTPLLHERSRKPEPSSIAYVLFPYKNETGEPATRFCRMKIRPIEILKATIQVDVPHADRTAVCNAIRLWCAFGGIGARTHRGCGALTATWDTQTPQVIKDKYPLRPLDSSPDTVNHWLRSILACAPSSRAHSDLRTTLSKDCWRKKGSFLMDPRMSEIPAFAAWNSNCSTLLNFRQQRNRSRGRSKWPEPDTVRRIVKQSLDGMVGSSFKKHAPSTTIDSGFPRGEIGLPMEMPFHNKQSEKNGLDTNKDPHTTTLKCLHPADTTKTAERKSSPLILRPVMAEDKTFFNVVLILKSPSPSHFVLETKRRESDNLNCQSEAIRVATETGLANVEVKKRERGKAPSELDYIIPLSSIPPSNATALNNAGTAIEAFRNFIEADGFTKVAVLAPAVTGEQP